MRRLRIYIAGPVSNGDVEENVRAACRYADELIYLGYAPLIPQLTVYLQSPVASLSAGFDNETWMEVDLPWVEVADAVLRIPGMSRGADREVAHAIAKGIPVYHSIEELKKGMAARKAFPVIQVHDAKKKAHDRKQYPVASGVIDFFPDALKAVAHCSHVGNEQHHPGQPLHWDRIKSTDEADALLRHFMERGKVDSDGVAHSAKVAWRSLALLQKEIEAAA